MWVSQSHALLFILLFKAEITVVAKCSSAVADSREEWGCLQVRTGRQNPAEGCPRPYIELLFASHYVGDLG